MKIKSTWGRRLAAATLSLAAGGLMAVAAQAPASAGNFNGSCESGEICLFDNIGFTGSKADFYDNVSNYGGWHFYNSPYWLANNVESAMNKADWSCLEIYNGANYSGGGLVLLSSIGTAGDEAGNMGAGRAESHKFFNSFPSKCQV